MKYKGILIDDISLFKHPAVYLELFLKLIIDGLKGIKNLVFTRYILLISLAIIWTLLCTIESLYVLYILLSSQLKRLLYLQCIGYSWE